MQVLWAQLLVVTTNENEWVDLKKHQTKRTAKRKNSSNRMKKSKKRLDRKHNTKKGQTLEEQFGYVDEYGRLTDTPPTGIKRAEINAEDIVLGATMRIEEKPEDLIRTGTVSFFNDSKGYGFHTRPGERKQRFRAHQFCIVSNQRKRQSNIRNSAGPERSGSRSGAKSLTLLLRKANKKTWH
jgi:hypothetical protein